MLFEWQLLITAHIYLVLDIVVTEFFWTIYCYLLFTYLGPFAKKHLLSHSCSSLWFFALKVCSHCFESFFVCFMCNFGKCICFTYIFSLFPNKVTHWQVFVLNNFNHVFWSLYIICIAINNLFTLGFFICWIVSYISTNHLFPWVKQNELPTCTYIHIYRE